MHVMVLGAGVTGITTAWYLLQAGHEVTVLERREDVGLETSFANGGQISVSHPEPWSSPAAPLIALRSLGKPDAPLRFRFGTDWQRYVWAVAFLRECLPGRHRRNAERIARLALRSVRALRQLREQTGIDYDHRAGGILHLLRDPAALSGAGRRIQQLAEWGIRATLMKPSECCALEPALARAPDLLGAIHAPDDESGDAHRFTQVLAGLFTGRGGRLLTGHDILGLVREGTRITQVLAAAEQGSTRALQADAFVVCLGVGSASLLAPLGLRLPIYPVKGYSITVPIVDPARVTTVSLTDETRRLVCSRFGDRLRLAGTADIDGYDKRIDPRRIASLRAWIDAFFPGATDLTSAEAWAGLRPCTPSYAPLIGASGIDGLWLNTGHGSLGWTLACGSAEAVRDELHRQSVGSRAHFQVVTADQPCSGENPDLSLPEREPR